MHFIQKEIDWLHIHATRGEDGIWRCDEKGTPIEQNNTGRSIWDCRPFQGGSGEVRSIVHLHCPTCQKDFELPRHGEPIYEDELVLLLS